MQPEDIDKLFRDQLAEHAPTPPAYLWNQLEDELQPRKKRPVLWLWAAAASVALVLVSSLLWLQLGPGSPAGSATVATVSADAGQSASAPAEKKSEIISETQATPPRQLASNHPKAAPAETPAAPLRQPQTAHLPARQLAAAPASPRGRSRRETRAARPATPAPEALAAAPSKTQPERLAAVAATIAPPRQLPALAATAAPTGPIVVEVRRTDVALAVAAATTDEPAPRRSLGGLLLRQARNVVRGERVTLPKVEVPETVTVQARVAGHTLTKVIEL